MNVPTIAQLVQDRSRNPHLTFLPVQARFIALNLDAVLANLLAAADVHAVLECCRYAHLRSPFLMLESIQVEPLCPISRAQLVALQAHLPALRTVQSTGPGTTWSWSCRHARLSIAYHVSPTQIVTAPPNLLVDEAQVVSVHMSLLGPRPAVDLASALTTHRPIFHAASAWSFDGGDVAVNTLVAACIRAKVTVPASLRGPFADCLSDLTDFLRHHVAARLGSFVATPRTPSITPSQFGQLRLDRVRLDSLELVVKCVRASTIEPTWADIQGYGMTMKAIEKSLDYEEAGYGPLSSLVLHMVVPLDVGLPPLDTLPPGTSVEKFAYRAVQLSATHRGNILKAIKRNGRCTVHVGFDTLVTPVFWQQAGQWARDKLQTRLDDTLAELRRGTYLSPRQRRRAKRDEARDSGQDRQAEFSETSDE